MNLSHLVGAATTRLTVVRTCVRLNLMSATPTNPYDAPSVASDEHQRTASISSGSHFGVATVLTGAIFLAFLITRGPLARTYADFGAELPNATAIAISLGALAAVGLLFFTTIAKQYLIRSKAVLRFWNGLASVIAIVVAIAYAMAVLLPFSMPMYGLT